jgi:hypothetical protein
LSKSSILFTGTRDKYISGSGVFQFGHLGIDKQNNSAVILQSDIHVTGQLRFVNGLLNVNKQAVTLGSTGMLFNENEQSHAFTTGSGYIERTQYLDRPSGVNPGNLGIIISSTQTMGTTIIRRGTDAQDAGKHRVTRYFDIRPANNRNLNAAIRFTYFDKDVTGSEQEVMSLMQSEDGMSWTSLGYDHRNTSTNVVEKKGVQALHRITVAALNPSVPSGLRKSVLYPNPVLGMTTVSIHSKQDEECKMTLFDSKGTVVKVLQKNLQPGVNQVGWNLGDIPQGSYSVQILRGGQMETIQLHKF